MDILNRIDSGKIQQAGRTGKHNIKQRLPYKDAYIPGFDITGQFQCITYNKGNFHKNTLEIDIVKGYIPWDIVDKINNGAWYSKKDNVYMLDGLYFKKESIPPISQRNLQEVKAEDNVISFGEHNYFKYVSKDGKEHYMHTGKTGFGIVFTEDLRGTLYNHQAARYIRFWNATMTVTGPDLPGRDFEYDEVEGYLKEAGIKPGFFTVNMKESSRTLYYSQNRKTRMVIRKEDYDEQYANLTVKNHLLRDYKPGSIFKINGKEYALSENHTLDIPYGEDIYNMEHPVIPL